MTILDRRGRTDLRIATGTVNAARCGPRPGCMVWLRRGRAVGVYHQRRRWAPTWGGVHVRAGGAAERELALSEYLDILRTRGLWPVFVALPDPAPFERRAFTTQPWPSGPEPRWLAVESGWQLPAVAWLLRSMPDPAAPRAAVPLQRP